MATNNNLQPWLDYFTMLQQYERKGFLEVKPDNHEAYVTQPALFAMTDGDNPQEQMKGAVSDTVRNIRAYAAYLSRQSGMEYYDEPFAVHVVRDTYPHDLLYTLLLTRRRVWWKLWMKADCMEIINYQADGK